MKLFLAVIVILFLCTTYSPSSYADTHSQNNAAKSSAITAVSAAQKMGKGFNLGQMFENDQHPATLASAKPKIDAYYENGFRLVRIPVTWTETLGGVQLADGETGKINRSLPKITELKAVVDYALGKPDMFVIINAHHEKALKDGNKAKVLEQLWADISDIFKDRNHHLIFQILNEPHLNNRDPMLPENLRHMTSLAYHKIRAVDAERIIAIGGNQWFAADEMAKVWPNLDQVGGGKDQYLMATFHHYNPWTFNGDNQGDYSDNWTDADMSGPMDTMLQWSNTIGQGMPIYIGEWGTGWQSRYSIFNCNNIRLWYSKFNKEYASIKGIPTAVWDDGGWFKIFDHKTNSFENNLIECINGKCKWDGKERFNKGCK
ncbi:MAG: cellulase family glycosylhydrolase [Pseudomonadota bacterium]|nr:cellulase family glycosylhydrolase [Pseudomonadota bacterium]